MTLALHALPSVSAVIPSAVLVVLEENQTIDAPDCGEKEYVHYPATGEPECRGQGTGVSITTGNGALHDPSDCMEPLSLAGFVQLCVSTFMDWDLDTPWRECAFRPDSGMKHPGMNDCFSFWGYAHAGCANCAGELTATNGGHEQGDSCTFPEDPFLLIAQTLETWGDVTAPDEESLTTIFNECTASPPTHEAYHSPCTDPAGTHFIRGEGTAYPLGVPALSMHLEQVWENSWAYDEDETIAFCSSTGPINLLPL